MDRHLRLIWYISILAGSIILYNQITHLCQLYENEKGSYAHEQNNRIRGALYEFNMKSADIRQTISFNAENNLLIYIINGKRHRYQLTIKDDILKINEQTTYDVRDTTDWTLDNFHAHLQAKQDSITNKQLSIRFFIQDSTGKIKDTCPQGSIITSACEFQSQLGFITKDTLYASYSYPFRLFIQVADGQIVLIFFTTALLVLCFLSLLHMIRMEKQNGKYREAFVHHLVHDLKRPIVNEIRTNYLLEDIIPPEQTSLLKQSNSQLNNMLKSANRILLQSTNAHGLRLHAEEIDLHEMLNKLRNCKQWNVQNNKQFNIGLEYLARQRTITADPNFLQPLFCNLVENALKYSGQQVDITITCEDIDEKTIRIKIKDSGFGITTHALKRIFNRFNRGDQQNNMEIKGHGQGLYFVQLILRAHGGSISAESTPEKGSTFTTTLPKKTKN